MSHEAHACVRACAEARWSPVRSSGRARRRSSTQALQRTPARRTDRQRQPHMHARMLAVPRWVLSCPVGACCLLLFLSICMPCIHKHAHAHTGVHGGRRLLPHGAPCMARRHTQSPVRATSDHSGSTGGSPHPWKLHPHLERSPDRSSAKAGAVVLLFHLFAPLLRRSSHAAVLAALNLRYSMHACRTQNGRCTPELR